MPILDMMAEYINDDGTFQVRQQNGIKKLEILR